MPPLSVDQANVIVLAGDIWKKDNGISWARATWPEHRVVCVAGNHEYYGQQRKSVQAMIRIAARQYGVDFLDNEELIITDEHESVRILGSTLWTDFELFGKDQKHHCMAEGQRALNDFRVIHEGERHFSPQDSIDLHRESVAWLKQKLDEPFDGPTIVVTHHAPCWGSVAPRWQSDPVSACFASRLNHLLDGNKVNLWIHGHTHDSFDYEINGTRIIANPRGYTRYVGGEENDQFNPQLLIDVTPAGCEIVSPGASATPVEPQKMSARQRDAAIWAIDHLDVRTSGETRFVELWALRPDLRMYVQDIVNTNDRTIKEALVPDHVAIMPLLVDDINWLVDEIVKRAPETTRQPRRAGQQPKPVDPDVHGTWDPYVPTQITDELIESVRNGSWKGKNND